MMVSGGRVIEILISSGSRRMVFASCCILGGMVAENMIVCRSLGSSFSILMMSSKKPMSSMRSASSRMKYFTPEKSML